MMKKLNIKFINKKFVIISLFFIFFFILLWQHAYIYLYHDDFGYASLSYFGDLTDDIPGHEFTFMQMMGFLRKHYLTWGGRILPFFTLLSLLRWDFWLYRFVQSIVLTLILFFSAKFISNRDFLKKNFLTTCILLMALYGLIPIQLHQNGTYWATAAVLYVWPFLWIYGAGNLLNQYVANPKNKLMLIFIGFLFFAIGFSHEQIFFVAFFMLLGFLISHILEKKTAAVIKADLICIAILIIGFLFLILSPGTLRRSESPIYRDFYALNLIDRIKYNFPSFLQITFGKQNLVFFIILLITNILYLLLLIQKDKRGKRGLMVFAFIQFLMLVILVLLLFSSTPIIDSSWLGPIINPIEAKISYSAWFWLLFLALVSIPGFVFSYYHNKYVLYSIYAGGLFAQLTSLFIPTINFRISLIFLFSLFPFLTTMLVESLNKIGKQSLKVFLLSGLILVSMINTGTLIAGYQKNITIHRDNQQTLVCSQVAIQQGADISIIYLKKLKDDQYAGAMPYIEGYDYINYWIKDYFKIPLDVELVWQ